MSKVIELQDAQFTTEVIESQDTVLAYFWASWCGPCRLVSPSIAWLADNYQDRLKVVKLEIDASPESVANCQVEGVPALRVFRNGEIIASLEGAVGKQKLQEFVEAVIN